MFSSVRCCGMQVVAAGRLEKVAAGLDAVVRKALVTEAAAASALALPVS